MTYQREFTKKLNVACGSGAALLSEEKRIDLE